MILRDWLTRNSEALGAVGAIATAFTLGALTAVGALFLIGRLDD